MMFQKIDKQIDPGDVAATYAGNVDEFRLVIGAGVEFAKMAGVTAHEIDSAYPGVSSAPTGRFSVDYEWEDREGNVVFRSNQTPKPTYALDASVKMRSPRVVIRMDNLTSDQIRVVGFVYGNGD